MRLEIVKGTGYASAQPTEGSLVIRRADQKPGTGPVVICNHGHGANCLQYMPNDARNYTPGWFAYLLAREGYQVMAIDDAGISTWGDQASTDRINDAIAVMQTYAGGKAGKVGMMGWSMGGLATLNWLDRNPEKHAASWLWAPATNMDFFHSDPSADPSWGPEIDAAYPGGYSADNPIATPANYRGVGAIKLVHAVDDATIPIAQSRAFRNAVNDPNVTLKEVPNGNHTALFGNVTDLEIVQFFKDNLPV